MFKATGILLPTLVILVVDAVRLSNVSRTAPPTLLFDGYSPSVCVPGWRDMTPCTSEDEEIKRVIHFARKAEKLGEEAGKLFLCKGQIPLVSLFARMVFPDRKVMQGWSPHLLRETSQDDILFTSRGSGCSSLESFPGKVVLLDGERGTGWGSLDRIKSDHLFYLGVKDPALKNLRDSQKIYLPFVVYQSLIHPYRPPDLLKPRGQRHPHFLVYLNSNCVSFREHAFDAIVKMALAEGLESPVSAGKCHGHYPKTASTLKSKEAKSAIRHLPQSATAISELSPYRFSLCMENTAKAGYVTEKIANAFVAGTVPIYYGDKKSALDIFNKDAFIFYDPKNPKPSLDLILKLERDPEAYAAMLAKPILREGAETLDKYFSVNDEVGRGSMKKRIREMVLGSQ